MSYSDISAVNDVQGVVLIACGSFNPITIMHLRMMELSRDKIENTICIQTKNTYVSNRNVPSSIGENKSHIYDTVNMNNERQIIPCQQSVICGILSPVSDAYKKKGLISSTIRFELAQVACQTTSDWIVVDDWELLQPQWVRTRCVLDHFKEYIEFIFNKIDINIVDNVRSGNDGRMSEEWLMGKFEKFRRSIRLCNNQSSSNKQLLMPRVKLVCGADFLESFAVPNLWMDEDIETIVRDYGIVCITRTGIDVLKAIHESDILSKYEANILIVTEWCQNAISSTFVRLALSRGESVRYIVPSKTLEEIYARGLYGTKLQNNDEKSDVSLKKML